MATLRCELNQTIFDVAIKKNGNIENIFLLMNELGVTDINESLTNTVFTTPFNTNVKFVKDLFMSNTNIVTGDTFYDTLNDLNTGAFDEGFDNGFDTVQE